MSSTPNFYRCMFCCGYKRIDSDTCVAPMGSVTWSMLKTWASSNLKIQVCLKNQSMWYIFFFCETINEYCNLALFDLSRTECFETSHKYFDVTCFFEVLLVSWNSLLWYKKRGFVGMALAVWKDEFLSE